MIEHFRTLGEYTSILSARMTCVRALPWAILHLLQQYLGPLLSATFNHTPSLWTSNHTWTDLENLRQCGVRTHTIWSLYINLHP